MIIPIKLVSTLGKSALKQDSVKWVKDKDIRVSIIARLAVNTIYFAEIKIKKEESQRIKWLEGNKRSYWIDKI